MGIRVGIGKLLIGSGGTARWTPINEEVANYILGLAAPLSLNQKKTLDKFVSLVKTDCVITNFSDLFDCLWLISGETKESSYRNLVKNAHHLTDVVAPTWTKFEGIQGNGTTQYVNSHFNPKTQGVRFTQNDCSIGAQSNIVAPTAGRVKIGAYDYLNTGGETNVYTKAANGQGKIGVNSYHAMATLSVIDNTTLIAASRDVSNDGANWYEIFNEALELGLWRHIASVDPYNGNIFLLANNQNETPTGFCDDQLAFAYLGKSMTWTQWNRLRQAYITYKADIGKGLPIIGTDMFKNGGFDDASIWTYVYGDWSIADGVVHRLATSATMRQPYYYYRNACTYSLRFTVRNCASKAKMRFIGNGNSPWAEFQGYESFAYYANGTHDVTLTCVSETDPWFEIESSGSVTFDLDDVSLVKLT